MLELIFLDKNIPKNQKSHYASTLAHSISLSHHLDQTLSSRRNFFLAKHDPQSRLREQVLLIKVQTKGQPKLAKVYKTKFVPRKQPWQSQSKYAEIETTWTILRGHRGHPMELRKEERAQHIMSPLTTLQHYETSNCPNVEQMTLPKPRRKPCANESVEAIENFPWSCQEYAKKDNFYVNQIKMLLGEAEHFSCIVL